MQCVLCAREVVARAREIHSSGQDAFCAKARIDMLQRDEAAQEEAGTREQYQ